MWQLELESTASGPTCGVMLADASGRRFGANPDELDGFGTAGCAAAVDPELADPAPAASPGSGTATSSDAAAGGNPVQQASFLLPAGVRPAEVVIDYPSNAPYVGVLSIAQPAG